MQKELSSEIKKIKAWVKENKVLDVVLFGSAARGKTRPNDIDVCIIISDNKEEKSLDLIDSFGKLTDKFKFEFHTSILTASSFVLGATLTKTILNEGHSIKDGKRFSLRFGYESKSLFIYTLKHFTPSRRVQFHYLLKGRYGSRGILKEVNGKFLGTGSIVVPAEKEDLFKEILDKWRVKYKIKKILVS